MKIVLSIDGGGIRGIIPALMLARIEEATGLRTAEMCDLVAGTSTGGILALALSVPGESGGPRYSARELVDLYALRGREIFSRSFWRGVHSVAALADEKYSAEPLEGILWEYLGDWTVEDAATRVLVSAYEIESRCPWFFKSWSGAGRFCLMRDAARATSAAPTYFEPAEIPAGPLTERLALIDGGVYLNNPAMSAYAEARRLWPEDGRIVVISLGTGEATRPIPCAEARDWGAVGWIAPLLSTMFDGQSDAVDYQLRQILRGDYLRIQGRLDLAMDDMDNASASNIQALEVEANRMARAHAGDLSEIIDLLRSRERRGA